MKCQGMGSNQSMPVYQGRILPECPTGHPRGNDWLCGRGETAGVHQLDHNKALSGVSHRSLVAGLMIGTARREPSYGQRFVKPGEG